MVAYNYPAAEAASATGSGAGIKAASCRTDAFSGSDKPYNNAQLKEMDGAPGATGGCAISFVPPFQPNNPTEWPLKKVGEEDAAGNIMSFPIGGSSVAVVLHLGTTACKVRPAELNFTSKELSRIMGGDAKEWGDAELVATNPALKECEKAKITRVVRQDDSGTTGIFKRYLTHVDNTRTGAVCAAGKT